MRVTRRFIRSSIINIGIFLVLYLAIHFYQTRYTPSGAAPDIKGITLDAREISGLAELEKPLLVHFWATWCKICSFEHDSINNIAKDYTVLGIASQSGAHPEVASYAEDKGLEYQVMLDSNGSLAKQWGITGFPTSFVIDKENQIRFVEVGLTSELGLRVRLFIANLL